MKSIRQAKLIEIIRNNAIDTQEELQRRLLESGFDVTQATISRDVRELGITKVSQKPGGYKYFVPEASKNGIRENKFFDILHQTVHSVAKANNLVVVKTMPGMGNAAGAAVDALQFAGIVGTLAGDDTPLIIAEANEAADNITDKLLEVTNK